MKPCFFPVMIVSFLMVGSVWGERPPNLVLILADDLSADAIGCYGAEDVRTPVLDGLAAEGMRYTHCYAPALCMPSRTELLTGKYSHRNYLGRGHLAVGEVNIASELRKVGYATCQIEKWHLNINKGAMPPGAGFDEYYHTKLSHNYFDPVVDVNGEETVFEGGYGPKICQEYAFDFIERHRNESFFLYYALHLPHAPYHEPPGFDLGEKASANEQYFAMIEHMDLMVGELVEFLDSMGLREETLIIFVGDNGTPKEFIYGSNGRVMAGGKSSPLDSGTHVPMIVSWPGTTPGGVVTDNLVDFADFLPTALELAGGKAKPWMKLDGHSFYRQVTGDAGAPVRRIAFKFGVKNGGKGAGPVNGYWARTQRWKLYDDGRFYDMKNDPLEERLLDGESLGAEGGATRKKLERFLEQSGAAEAVKRWKSRFGGR